jgi:hypothetical protein
VSFSPFAETLLRKIEHLCWQPLALLLDRVQQIAWLIGREPEPGELPVFE